MKKSLMLAFAAVSLVLLGGARSKAAMTVTLQVDGVTPIGGTNTGTRTANINLSDFDGSGSSFSSLTGGNSTNAGLAGTANMFGAFSFSIANFSAVTKQVKITFTETTYNLANYHGGVLGDPNGNVYTSITNTGTGSAINKGTLVTTANGSPPSYAISTGSVGTTYLPTPFTSTSSWTITTTITYNINALSVGSVSGFQFNSVAATPAPSALLLAGFGLPLFGLMRRGFRRNKVATTEPTVAA